MTSQDSLKLSIHCDKIMMRLQGHVNLLRLLKLGFRFFRTLSVFSDFATAMLTKIYPRADVESNDERGQELEALRQTDT